MPVLAFLAAAGLALLALLFVADSMLEDSSPPIVTSSRVGLPKRWHQDTIKVLTTMPAPAPDMTSSAVRAAQPKSDPEALTKIDPQRARRAPKCHPRIMPKYQPRIIMSRRRLTIDRTAGPTDFQLAVNSAAVEH